MAHAWMIKTRSEGGDICCHALSIRSMMKFRTLSFLFLNSFHGLRTWLTSVCIRECWQREATPFRISKHQKALDVLPLLLPAILEFAHPTTYILSNIEPDLKRNHFDFYAGHPQVQLSSHRQHPFPLQVLISCCISMSLHNITYHASSYYSQNPFL